MDHQSKATIRQDMRLRRRALTPEEQHTRATQLADQGHKLPHLFAAERIGSYRAFGGEIDTLALEKQLSGELFLPKITDFKTAQMQFFAYGSKTNVSDLGITEPDDSLPPIDLTTLDAVLVPLVAFKRDGSRLGMGAGFYDRAFEFRREPAVKLPVLVGVAHDFQECKTLEPDHWDVPLDVIITNNEVIFP